MKCKITTFARAQRGKFIVSGRGKDLSAWSVRYLVILSETVRPTRGKPSRPCKFLRRLKCLDGFGTIITLNAQ